MVNFGCICGETSSASHKTICPLNEKTSTKLVGLKSTKKRTNGGQPVSNGVTSHDWHHQTLHFAHCENTTRPIPVLIKWTKHDTPNLRGSIPDTPIPLVADDNSLSPSSSEYLIIWGVRLLHATPPRYLLTSLGFFCVTECTAVVCWNKLTCLSNTQSKSCDVVLNHWNLYNKRWIGFFLLTFQHRSEFLGWLQATGSLAGPIRFLDSVKQSSLTDSEYRLTAYILACMSIFGGV